MGSTRYYFARRRVGKKNQIHWNERRRANLKMVQEMPDQEITFPIKRGKEERSYIHLVSPSHTPQPSSILVWTARGVGRKVGSRHVWDVEEVATCNDLDLLASNETSTSSHLNVARPRMTVGFKVGIMLPD